MWQSKLERLSLARFSRKACRTFTIKADTLGKGPMFPERYLMEITVDYLAVTS